TKDIAEFAQSVCLQIAALRPLYLSVEDVDPKLLEREKDILKEQIAGSGKPEKIINQIIEGRLNKFYSEICLLKQTFIKNDQKTVHEALLDVVARTGENIKIKRFARFEIGA
ncbi:elongation factor Ts, partial [bacterium]|nr:elongation factor Ts [bacterium]